MSAALGPTLETARLILRPPVTEDLDGLAAFGADPEATRFLGGPGSRATAWRVLALFAGSWALHGFGLFSVVERASGRWIGRIGPWQPEGWPGTEVGWALLTAVRGRGYALEASIAAIDWAVDSLGWDDIVHFIDPANAPSIVLAHRLGSIHRGSARLPSPQGETSTDVWGQSAAEWRARRAQLPSFGPHQPGR